MISGELVDRINYLIKKEKTEGLTPEEKEEQKKVRAQYLEGIRAQVRAQMADVGIKKKEHRHGHHHGKKCSCHKSDCKDH